ncbi:MAG TPA: hypothetical protein VM536_02995, partial [Chloroflexia bacterium]|nr:hypothetical protein [Chloroflexia bacterium]
MNPPTNRGALPAPGEHVDLTLSDMAYGGDAVGRTAAGNVVFAWGGISGEQVTAQVDRVKRDLTWATVSDVREPAALRVTPPCPYFGPCGGCQWQHVAYEGQLDFKTHILREQLRRGAGLPDAEFDLLIRATVGMDDPWQYRNIAHFQVDPVTHQLGYFRRNSHTVVPVAVCPISDPGINALLTSVQTLFAEQAQAPGDLPANISALDLEAVRRGQMPVAIKERKVSGLPVWQVTIRTGAPPAGPVPADAPWAGREMTVVLHTLGGEKPDVPAGRRGRGEQEAPRVPVLLTRKSLRRWVEGLAGHVSLVELRQDGALELIAETAAARAAAGEDASEIVQPTLVSASRRAAREVANEDRPEAPPGVVRQRLGGSPYWVAPPAFFQVNNAQAEVLLALVRAALPMPVPLLVDAYSGVGAFALALLDSGHAAQV